MKQGKQINERNSATQQMFVRRVCHLKFSMDTQRYFLETRFLTISIYLRKISLYENIRDPNQRLSPSQRLFTSMNFHINRFSKTLQKLFTDAGSANDTG